MKILYWAMTVIVAVSLHLTVLDPWNRYEKSTWETVKRGYRYYGSGTDTPYNSGVREVSGSTAKNIFVYFDKTYEDSDGTINYQTHVVNALAKKVENTALAVVIGLILPVLILILAWLLEKKAVRSMKKLRQ